MLTNRPRFRTTDPTPEDTDTNTSPSHTRRLKAIPPRRREHVRIIATLVCDVGLVAVCANILWHNGGSNVANGAWIGTVICFIIAAAFITARNSIPLVLPRRHGRSRVRTELALALAHCVGITALVAAWQLTGQYYLGWVATFAVVVLLIGSVLQFLGALIDRPVAAGSAPRQRSIVTRHIRALTWIRLGMCTLIAAALIILAPVHTWTPLILNTLILEISGAALFGVVAASWIAAFRRGAPRTQAGSVRNPGALPADN